MYTYCIWQGVRMLDGPVTDQTEGQAIAHNHIYDIVYCKVCEC